MLTLLTSETNFCAAAVSYRVTIHTKPSYYPVFNYVLLQLPLLAWLVSHIHHSFSKMMLH